MPCKLFIINKLLVWSKMPVKSLALWTLPIFKNQIILMIVLDHKVKLPAISLNSNKAVYTGKQWLVSVPLHLNTLELKTGLPEVHPAWPKWFQFL